MHTFYPRNININDLTVHEYRVHLRMYTIPTTKTTYVATYLLFHITYFMGLLRMLNSPIQQGHPFNQFLSLPHPVAKLIYVSIECFLSACAYALPVWKINM